MNKFSKKEILKIETLNKLADLKLQPTLTICRDGQYSRMESYKPIVRRKLQKMGTKLDYWFQTSDWLPERYIDKWID